jgi:hypothetical protein
VSLPLSFQQLANCASREADSLAEGNTPDSTQGSEAIAVADALFRWLTKNAVTPACQAEIADLVNRALGWEPEPNR